LVVIGERRATLVKRKNKEYRVREKRVGEGELYKRNWEGILRSNGVTSSVSGSASALAYLEA